MFDKTLQSETLLSLKISNETWNSNKGSSWVPHFMFMHDFSSQFPAL